ncbi:MAG TPA: hypothetical protein VL860_07060 [Planctomycetota bacterium]|nr:hypothetical protein [Planctomycetota bacterium]
MKDPKIPLAQWYEEGLQFSCKVGCMRCCGGSPGDVWVTDEQIREIAMYLKMRPADFEAQYVRGMGERKSLIEKPNYDCIFVAEGPPPGYAAQVGQDWDKARDPTPQELASATTDAAARRGPSGEPEQHPIAGRVGHCSIYPVRPTQCRTYPFWKSVLDRIGDSAWRMHSESCPGINHGRTWTAEEIRARRSASNL